MTTKSVWAGRALLIGIAVAAFVAMQQPRTGPPAGAMALPPTGALTIAASGDIVSSRPIARSDKDEAFEAAIGVVRGATVAITNLEMSLLEHDPGSDGAGPRGAFGSAAEAAGLRSLGFDVVGMANNHATDYGPEGMGETRTILVDSGLLPAGAGPDLAAARAPVFVGRGDRKVAVVAVAISSSPESIATSARGVIQARPGINPLRYAADVTVDAPTYETLRQSAPALQGGQEPAADQFTLLGTTIKKGERTSVNLVPDRGDIEAILAQVRRARQSAEVVVLSVHSHEPSNDSDRPADFFRALARQAIDARAALIVGHGPHRIRGVEVYNGGAILYSVGNFLYQLKEGQSPSTDQFDGGVDMYSLATGISGGRTASRFGIANEEWWEGAVAAATFESGALRSLQVHPVDLGWDRPADRRGVPRKPAAPRAIKILDRLARLSQPYNTTVRIENGVGIVVIE